MSELKPCPFCGGKANKVKFGQIQMFECKKCRAVVSFCGAESEPKATKAWNRRAENAER